MRRNSGVIGSSIKTSTSSASGIHDSFDQYNNRINAAWPVVKKFNSITQSSTDGAASYIHFEGTTKTFWIDVEGFFEGDFLFYTIAAVSGSITSTDFVNNPTLSGSVTYTPGYQQTSISLETSRDTSSESDTYKVQIRTGSVSGPILGESTTIEIPDPSYTITPSTTTANEGDTITFNVSGTNIGGGRHYFSTSGTAGGAFSTSDITPLNGDFTISSNTGSFQVTILEDFLTEGTETLSAEVRIGSTFGQIVAATGVNNAVTISDTSQTISATCTPSASSVNEGSSVTFTVNTTNYTSGTLQWEAVLSADMESSDISADSGTVSISNSTGSIVITATSDGYTETGQTESFQIKILHPGDLTNLVTSSAVTINDTSTGTPEPSGTDITSSFYEISNRFLDSGAYMGNSADYNGPYDVGEVQTDFSGSGRVYIGVKVTAATTFYNDIPIAGVQIISGSTLVASWIFNTSSGGSGSGWQTYTSQILGSSTIGFPVTPATASGYSYVNITTSANVTRFTWASATGSSYTGATDGIGNTYKLSADGGSNTLATVGDAQVSQTSSTYYAYRETSGSSRYSGAVMRSPTYNFSGGEYIRVIHAVTGYSQSQMDPDDSLYVAVY